MATHLYRKLLSFIQLFVELELNAEFDAYLFIQCLQRFKGKWFLKLS